MNIFYVIMNFFILCGVLCLRYYNNIIYITLYAVISAWKNFTTEYGVLEKIYIRIKCLLFNKIILKNTSYNWILKLPDFTSRIMIKNDMWIRLYLQVYKPFLAFFSVSYSPTLSSFFLVPPEKFASQSQNFIIRQQENILHEDLLSRSTNSKAYTSE